MQLWHDLRDYLGGRADDTPPVQRSRWRLPHSLAAQAANGDLYGTTSGGGAGAGLGTVYKFSTGGTLTILHSFNESDSTAPQAGLVLAAGGGCCGTTLMGGSYNNYGTIFSITPAGALTTPHKFHNDDAPLSGHQRPGAVDPAAFGYRPRRPDHRHAERAILGLREC